MTGEPNLEALQFGFANAETLQEKLGIPAIVFGIGQALVLLAIYRAILRREKAAAPAAELAPDTVGGEAAAE